MFINKFVEKGWLAKEDLLNSAYGGGPVFPSGPLTHLKPQKRYLRAVDREGKGIDLAVFHAQKVAKGSFDFKRVNRLCNVQIAPDVTPQQLAGFVEAGLVTREQLAMCASPIQEEPEDPYAEQMRQLVARVTAGKVNGRQKDDELERLRLEFRVKQKTIEQDFVRYAEERGKGVQRDVGFGFLTAEETALIPSTRNYVEDFAIVNTGGKAAVLALKQPDLAKAIMAPRDFELLHRRDWIEVTTEDGKTVTVHPAKSFISKPPKETRVYDGGFVFRPSGTVAANEFNLYRGMMIKPDSSGSCSLLYDLLREVWAHRVPEVCDWIREWLWHPFAFPGEKIGTTLAIRGAYGTGKSIVFECLHTILGDMLLRVANPKMILGDFNESLLGKLIVALEEAAFVGDKAAFDKMKELITGNQVLINPKFKAPIIVGNYARLAVISNHEHFLHLKPGDRRYTVVEATSDWQGSPRFECLLEQWHNGGAERFLHDALNHSFRRLEGQQTLVVARNITTAAAVRQMAQSRSPLERCIVEFLIKGALHRPKEPWEQKPANWDLDEPFEIGSQSLWEQVKAYLRENDPAAARHETSLNQIVSMLEMYVGETHTRRDKSRDEKTGRRLQLPTSRMLPPRKRALDHAFAKGLLTCEEYDLALPSPHDLLPTVDETDETDDIPGQLELFAGDEYLPTRVMRYGWR